MKREKSISWQRVIQHDGNIAMKWNPWERRLWSEYGSSMAGSHKLTHTHTKEQNGQSLKLCWPRVQSSVVYPHKCPLLFSLYKSRTSEKWARKLFLTSIKSEIEREREVNLPTTLAVLSCLKWHTLNYIMFVQYWTWAYTQTREANLEKRTEFWGEPEGENICKNNNNNNNNNIEPKKGAN